MTSFKHSKRLAVVAACIGATALAADPATAQQPDSATINGTIGFPVYGDHTWTLTLQGLSYSYHEAPSNYFEGLMTRVYATSFDFEFQGPHAAELNANVSDPLVNGGLPYGPFVEIINYKLLDGSDWYGVRDWIIQVAPIDDQQGLRFYSWLPLGYEWTPFATDANGYPVLAPFTSLDVWTQLIDIRNPPDDSYVMGAGVGTVSVSVGFSLPGDYNHDGAVDAADYIVWRKSPSTFGGNPGGYNTWRAHFGQVFSSGAARTENAVPEPPQSAVIIFAFLTLVWRRHSI